MDRRKRKKLEVAKSEIVNGFQAALTDVAGDVVSAALSKMESPSRLLDSTTRNLSLGEARETDQCMFYRCFLFFIGIASLTCRIKCVVCRKPPENCGDYNFSKPWPRTLEMQGS